MGMGPAAGTGRVLSLPAVTVTPLPTPLLGLVWPGPREGRGRGAPKLHPAPQPLTPGSQGGPLTPFPSHPYFPT